MPSCGSTSLDVCAWVTSESSKGSMTRNAGQSDYPSSKNSRACRVLCLVFSPGPDFSASQVYTSWACPSRAGRSMMPPGASGAPIRTPLGSDPRSCMKKRTPLDVNIRATLRATYAYPRCWTRILCRGRTRILWRGLDPNQSLMVLRDQGLFGASGIDVLMLGVPAQAQYNTHTHIYIYIQAVCFQNCQCFALLAVSRHRL